MRVCLWILPALIGCADKGAGRSDCPATECSDSGDAPAIDADVRDTGRVPGDTGIQGLDTGALDTARPDTGPFDSGLVDSGLLDTGLVDTERPDTAMPDTGGPDTGGPDTGRPDTGDSGLFDTGGSPPPPLDFDGDGFTILDGDCDDTDGAIHPDADEVCDSVDNNCDGEVDEGVESTWYLDFDGDGHGSDAFVMVGCSPAAGYVASADDCDDASDASFPGAEETCDEEDNDCDGEIDEGLTRIFFFDGDHDGFGDEAHPTEACTLVFGYADNDEDCDDSDPDIHPAATEICDAADNDCDGSTDEDSAADARTWFADTDGDGFGDAEITIASCAAPEGFIADSTDCDDSDPDIHPDATEVCDAADNDCDGSTDEDVKDPFYVDGDGDGHGTTADIVFDCSAPSGYAETADDCDDADGSIHPDATEVCDERDNDCDGDVDEGVLNTYYADGDGDGYGAGVALLACTMPAGFVDTAGDCLDTNSSVHPDVSAFQTSSYLRAPGSYSFDYNCDGEEEEELPDLSVIPDGTYWEGSCDGFSAGWAIDHIPACGVAASFNWSCEIVILPGGSGYRRLMTTMRYQACR